MQAASILKEKGLTPTVINPRILSDVDRETLDKLVGYRMVITVDDGILNGGFGQKVAAYLGSRGPEVVCLGLKNEFMDRYNAMDVLRENGMLPEQIAALAMK